MHCISCKAPSYWSPCWACHSRDRGDDITVRPSPQNIHKAQGPQSLNRVENPLEHALYREIHAQLHALWDKAARTSGFSPDDKNAWDQLDQMIELMAREGPGMLIKTNDSQDEDQDDQDEPRPPTT
jgi:hypothetical protein